MKRTKCSCILVVCLCLILTAMPVLARSYPYTDHEAPFESRVLMASNLQTIASESDETLFQDTGLSALGDDSENPIDPDSLTGGTCERACQSLGHARHSVSDFPGILTETGLPKAPLSEGSYKIGDTKEIYNDLYSHSNTGVFTAEVVYAGKKCTIWRDKAHPEEMPDMYAKLYGPLLDNFLLPAFYESLKEPLSIDVDGDGKIAFVLSSMESAKGYFSDADLFAAKDVPWATGNQMDMLHINSRLPPFGAFAPICHELVHLNVFSQTFGESDLWLEEVVALNTLAGVEEALASGDMSMLVDTLNIVDIPQANALIDTINSTGISVPFIGSGNYVPSGTAPYGQWYLLACYLTGQTRYLPGGGSGLSQTVLDAVTRSENGFTAGSCTKEALVKALTDIGFMGEDADGGNDFDDLILNYNTALFLRDNEGIYSLTNTGDPNNTDSVGRITLDRITPFTGTVRQLPGGGSACWLVSPGNVTPGTHGADIRCAGIYPDPIIVPAAVESSVPAGNVEPGTMVSLSCPTEGASIYYTTDENNLTMENGTLYTEPVPINTDTYVRAWAVKTNGSEKTYGQEITFRYQVSGPKGDHYESNNDFSDATSVSFPGRYEATLHLAEDKDYYSFTLESKSRLNLILTSPAGTSYGLSLYRENGLDKKEELKTSLLSEGAQSIRMEAEAGTYYVAVNCPEGKACSDKESYTLDLQRENDAPEKLTDLDFSEIHMVGALTDKENSPLFNDSVSKYGGGNFLKSASYLTSWMGPVYEKDFPYPDKDMQEYYAEHYDEFEYKESEPLYHIQNILFLPKRDRQAFIQHLKNAVYTYGAVEIYLVSFQPYQAGNSTYWYLNQEDYEKYSSFLNGMGHIVTVVGWDDNIPRENFCGYDGEENPLPENNGGFIIRNSWGPKTGEDGYFYLSYEDASMTRNSPAVYIADESTGNYNHQYINDIKGGVGTVNYNGQQSGTLSEVFTLDNKNSPELLKAVSMQLASANTHYEISVRIGDGSPQKVAEGTKKYAGYYTERLDTPLLIPAGETFEVILRLECTTEAPSIYVTANMPGSVSGVPAAEGKAFSYEGGDKPYDLSRDALYPCIRAFTCDVEAEGRRATTPKQTDETANASDGTSDSLPESITLTEPVTPEQVSQYGALTDDSTTGNDAAVPVTNLPDRYDLRESLNLTPVRDQGALGVCWAFASNACVEYSLASRSLNVVDYPSSLTLSHNSYPVVLNAGQNEQPVTLTATLEGSKNPPSSKIRWSVTGDVDSIRMEHTESVSGEAVQVLTALKPGTVTVTAQSDADMNVQASCKVTITNQGIESLELNPKKLVMKSGESRQLQVNAKPETAVDKTVLFESSQPDVAYVDSNGKVTALSEGIAVITARAGTAEATCQVTVKKSESGTAASGTSSNQGSGSATGDSSPILLWVLLCFGSVCTAGIIIRLKFRHKH